MKHATKKLCKTCNKRRDLKFFTGKTCDMCQVAKDNGVKVKVVVVKSLPSLKASVQKLVNKYVRLRDAKDGCISCKNGKCEQAGHFWAQGANGALRYNLDNLNGQCDSCNRWKSGNLNEYRLALVKKIGKKRLEWLDDHHHDVKRWTREELMDLQDHFKALLESVKRGGGL
jgi:hypothetical protein